MPRLSVVIPTLNRDAVLCDTLRYFFEDERYPDFEVIVIDQSQSHDADTQAFLDRHSSQMRYVRTDYTGLPRARNHGTRLAQGEIIVFVDDDVQPFPNFLAGHACVYEDSAVVGVAGAVLSPGRHLRSGAELGEEQYSKLVEEREVRFDVDFEYSPQWAVGCNASFRRSAIIGVGGFDEMFPGAAVGEDAEFSHRVKERGKLRFSPQAALVHLRAPTGGTRDASSQARYVRQLAFCVNYFYYRVGATRALRVKKSWDLLRQHALNPRALRSGATMRLLPAFCAGIIESERALRRPCKPTWSNTQ
jgi:GT2 family glycosyltransferase